MKNITLEIYRSVKYGFQNFGRNIFLSIATTSVMVLTLFGLGFFMIINQISDQALTSLQSKVDINVYIKESLEQADLQKFNEYVQQIPQVESSEIIDKEKALAIYKERFKENPVLIDSIQFLDTNPLPVTLIIQAKTSEDYTTIWEAIKQYPGFDTTVESSDYSDDKNVAKETIDQLNKIINTTRSVGLVVIIVLSVIAILITYNTIRLTMYSYRNEIEIMRLVGASDTQIKGPFFVEGILFGVFGTFISFLILFMVVFLISEPVNNFIPGSDPLSEYLFNNILLIVGIKLTVGVLLGIGSSIFAINRYLKV